MYICIFVRLGEAEKAKYHFKHAGPEVDPDIMAKAKVVLGHLKKCDDAKRLKDWHTVLKESGNAITAGADSAPMVRLHLYNLPCLFCFNASSY